MEQVTLKIALRHFNKGIHQWYGWKDLDAGEVYSNIKLNSDNAVMPTEEEVNAKIAELQVIEDRRSGYPAIGDQLDMLFHAIDEDETLKTQFAAFYTALKEVKDDNPKP
jgi:hypothetical protein